MKEINFFLWMVNNNFSLINVFRTLLARWSHLEHLGRTFYDRMLNFITNASYYYHYHKNLKYLDNFRTSTYTFTYVLYKTYFIKKYFATFFKNIICGMMGSIFHVYLVITPRSNYKIIIIIYAIYVPT